MEGIDSWFYARVRNHGSSSAQHFMVTFTVKPWAGTEFVYPADFIPCTAAAGGFEPAADEGKIVPVKWPAASVSKAGTHAGLLASVIRRGEDHPSEGGHVWTKKRGESWASEHFKCAAEMNLSLSASWPALTSACKT